MDVGVNEIIGMPPDPIDPDDGTIVRNGTPADAGYCEKTGMKNKDIRMKMENILIGVL